MTVQVNFRWKLGVGRLALVDGRVTSSALARDPAVYRIRVIRGDGVTEVYVGQAGDLQDRFDNYRAGTPTEQPPENPDQEGNQSWMLRRIRGHLEGGCEVLIDVVDNPRIRIAEEMFPEWAVGLDMRSDTNRERLALEGVALAPDIGHSVILNHTSSTDPDWLLNDRETRLVYG